MNQSEPIADAAGAIAEHDRRLMHAKTAVLGAAFGICSLDELALFKRLEELYFEGYGQGHDAVNTVLKDISVKLSKVILAHMAANRDEVKRLLDDIVKNHVKVVAPAPQSVQ